jgi:GTP-binding protein HflX
LVGYTNAGKSTLFNELTHAHVYAADQLFATLDPTLRRIDLPGEDPIILADTVGFIRDLPHDLVEAFQSTLEETREAALLLHIVDASHENYQDNIAQVNAVLKEIGADEVPQIEVFNKVDLLDDMPPRIDRDEQGKARRVWLSAAGGQGLDLLLQVLEEYFHHDTVTTWLNVSAADGKARAHLYQIGNVVQEQTLENGDLLLEVTLTQTDLKHALERFDIVDVGRVEPQKPQLINYCG